MIRIILLFSILLLIYATNCSSQQADGCGFENVSERTLKRLPWYNNNSFLDDVLSSINYFDIINDYKPMYRIPVKFWVYKDSNGETGGASESDLKNFIIDLNYYNTINKTGFSYYMRPDVGYIYKSRHKNMGYIFESTIQTFIHKSKGCVNVFVVDNLTQYIPLIRNRDMRGSYNKLTNAVTVKKNSSSTTLAHEVGHYFGLLHPHRNSWRGKSRQESVSRTRRVKGLFRSGVNCEINGDALCDTPADPNLYNCIDKDCNYICDKIDNWGDKYEPATNNIMSYTTYRRCRSEFTHGQIAVMHYNARRMNVENWSATLKRYDFDEYEPDDTGETATIIYPRRPLRHTFHRTFMGEQTPDANADVDWIRFKLKRETSKKVVLKTQAGKESEPDTEIFLYDNQMNLIASDDNGGGSGFSKIVVSNLNQEWYFVKICCKNCKIKNGDDEIFDYEFVYTFE